MVVRMAEIMFELKMIFKTGFMMEFWIILQRDRMQLMLFRVKIILRGPLHSVIQKEVISPRKATYPVWYSWRHTKQPYVGRFFSYHIRVVGFWLQSLKFSLFLYYFFICCDFNKKFWNLYHKQILPKGNSEIFSGVSIHIFQQKRMFLAVENVILTFFNLKTSN